jgi:radical SAM superfamily enzyme YgiQ (UPF0313 family)
VPLLGQSRMAALEAFDHRARLGSQDHCCLRRPSAVRTAYTRGHGRCCPDLHIVLGGPHPTESYLSVMGVGFVDCVCRGEAEESFPALVRTLLSGRSPEPDEIPGVYFLRDQRVRGVPTSFIDLDKFDRNQLLRYDLSPDEPRQLRLYRGAHGMAGAEYWPIALVRGCPYDCTFCGAFQMSGKRLRYRRVDRVVDDLEFYAKAYDQRHFSFIDDGYGNRD